MPTTVDTTEALHYKKYGGGGNPLIILHGLLGCRDNWHPVAKALSDGFEVYAVDQRNHGRSFHSRRCDYDALAEDIRRFMDTHGLKKAALLGHSMGGKAAMRFSAVYPERVNRLVIVDVSHKAHQPHHADAIAALRKLELGSLQGYKDAEERLKSEIPDARARLFLLKNLRPDPDGKFAWRVNLDAIQRHHDALCGAVAVRPFCKPCLFVRGGNSNYVMDADWPEIKRFFPLAELATIPAAGHWVHVDAKEAFLRSVAAFLAGPGANARVTGGTGGSADIYNASQ